MASNDEGHIQPQLRNNHGHADKYGTQLVDMTQQLQKKVEKAKPGGNGDDSKPAGGYDATAIPKGPPGYTLRITFHRAENLPFADLHSLSADPYILAILQTDLQKRHKQDPDLRFRTPTVHRDVNPTWNSSWTIAHVPASGFHLKCRLYDEDPADHDDRLGNIHVDVGRIDDDWQGFKERGFEVKKRMGSKRAYTLRGCAALLSRSVKLGGMTYISVENLGRSEGDGGRAYTIGPLPWTQHFSPLIGMIAGTKDESHGKDGKSGTEKYNFQAIQMQLQGPVPEHLYHRYVEFKPFVAGMFTSHTLRGRILNHALHHQHARVYNFDGSTKYGEFDKPSLEMTKQFLDFVRYDVGGRIFTYIITLDGHFRFTETGKEFGIDMLSKHTMHSDVSIYIAFSGEFFIRRLKHPHKDKEVDPDPGTEVMPPALEESNEKGDKTETEEQKKKEPEHASETNPHHSSLAPPTDRHDSGKELDANPSTKRQSHSWRRRSHSATSSARSPAAHADQTSAGEDPSKDPTFYELIIDNDSGTYRPNAKYLGQLKKYLHHNFPGLRVATLDCQKDEEKMQKLKSEQRERKKTSGQQITYMQNSSMSSISSSDEEDLENRAAEEQGTAGIAGIAGTGAIKSQWNKVKGLTRGEYPDDDEKPKHKVNGGTSQAKAPPRVSASTSTGEKHSFDTATEHGDNHFVTPKPSLGFGGLKQFENDDRPLSRGIDDELERRGLGGMSQEKLSMPDEKTNRYAGNSTGLGSVHHSVTSAA